MTRIFSGPSCRARGGASPPIRLKSPNGIEPAGSACDLIAGGTKIQTADRRSRIPPEGNRRHMNALGNGWQGLG